MKIKVTLGGTMYHIKVEESCFNTVKIGTYETGKNMGSEREEQIGYFSTMSSAVKKICQSHLSELDEVISLKEYAERIENAYRELMSQVDLKS